MSLFHAAGPVLLFYLTCACGKYQRLRVFHLALIGGGICSSDEVTAPVVPEMDVQSPCGCEGCERDVSRSEESNASDGDW